MFVKVNKKLLTFTKTLAQYILEFIAAVKSFMILVPDKVTVILKFCNFRFEFKLKKTKSNFGLLDFKGNETKIILHQKWMKWIFFA
jgi:hypothetical protein